MSLFRLWLEVPISAVCSDSAVTAGTSSSERGSRWRSARSATTLRSATAAATRAAITRMSMPGVPRPAVGVWSATFSRSGSGAAIARGSSLSPGALRMPPSRSPTPIRCSDRCGSCDCGRREQAAHLVLDVGGVLAVLLDRRQRRRHARGEHLRAARLTAYECRRTGRQWSWLVVFQTAT